MSDIIVGPTIPQYTRPEMLRAASKRGFRAEERLFDDWCDRGLLDNPPRAAGLGRGKGSMPRKWSERQLELWLCLLDLRQRRKVGHLQPLYAIPVYSWLYWGDAGDVPLRQVRRALVSWTRDVTMPRSAEQTRRDVTMLVRKGRSAKAKGDHTDIVSGVTDLLTSGRLYTDDSAHEELSYWFKRMIDPADKGEYRGHSSAPLTPDAATALITARFDAIKHLGNTPDWAWEWARAMILFAAMDYQANSATYLAKPAWQQLYGTETVQDLVNSACTDLLTVLGLSRISGWETTTANRLPTVLHPTLWRQGRLTISISTRFMGSHLILPYDMQATALTLEVEVAVQEKSQPVEGH